MWSYTQCLYRGQISWSFLLEDLNDDKDISRQCRKLYAQGNILVRKFHMCSPDVKVALFRAYCTPVYTAHLWCNFKKSSLRRLSEAFNDVMRMLLRETYIFVLVKCLLS